MKLDLAGHLQALTPALATLAILAACGGDGSAAPASPPPASVMQELTLRFAAVAGPSNAAVACGSPIPGLGRTPTDAQLADLRFYLSEIRLVDAQGKSVPLALATNEWQYTHGTDSVALVDLEDAKGACGVEGTAATNAVIRGTVPAGTYVGLRATLGVPEKLSHSDVMAAPAPLDLMAMGWSWQAGRKFAKIEVNPAGGVTTPSGSGSAVVATYALHLASTDCSGRNDGSDTCKRMNLARIELPLDPATQQVAIDVAELFAASDIRSNQGGAVGCMSSTADPDCAAVFAKAGLDLASGGSAVSPQTIFRAIPR